ncbi:hypothetical protein OVA26_16470 [Microbacterium sp. SL62]|uniref:hypothetical protein n=1 Tax=Microbacterium sp. SL62 TaxID=2995139 RepID=UPI002274622B|nr:hypothetical protein [Microbacterium sp. SL62]MCY1718532.1 hypothetical protein [Microbacterium sp. SL62]
MLRLPTGIPTLKNALAAWDALNPGDPFDEIEAAASSLAEAARIAVVSPELTSALDALSGLRIDAPVEDVQRAAARLQAASAAFAPAETSPFARLEAPGAALKDPLLLAREAMDRRYGLGTEWEEPNIHGEEHFTRAQAESDIDADEILSIIVSAVEADRAQSARALNDTPTVTTEGAPQ